MRGICYVELSVETANQDAHSGLGGSIFPNAAWRRVWALNTLKDEAEKILIPGFYDNVVPPTRRDLELLEQLPDQGAALRQMYGLENFVRGLPDEGVELKQAAVFEPTCTICGLTSGYQGPGSKTVLPATATAKVDFRLVPQQTPQEIVAKLRSHLDEQGFGDVSVRLMGGGRPARVDPDHPLVQLAAETAVSVYDRQPLIEPIIGGSGPNYPFIHVLGLPVITAGVGYPGSQVHAPNENMRLDHFVNGVRHTAHIVAGFEALDLS
jgi:acetylornithine deacetylase/succinyl-diaminopimelate desuccinylase-like protein